MNSILLAQYPLLILRTIFEMGTVISSHHHQSTPNASNKNNDLELSFRKFIFGLGMSLSGVTLVNHMQCLEFHP